MAVTLRKDGRWAVYYRVKDPETNKSRIKWEYFGRGAGGEAAARARDSRIYKKDRRPAKKKLSGPIFGALAKEYATKKGFEPSPLKHLYIRLEANILPFLGNMPAVRITDNDLFRYIKKRSSSWADKKKTRHVKKSTINRELTDIQAILNWSAGCRPPLIPFNPVKGFKKPAGDDAIIMPPTRAEAQAIIKAASPHLVRAILLSYYLGLRPGAVELLSLVWPMVDIEGGTILVISAKKGKKGRPVSRLVPINKALIPDLRAWHEADGFGAGPVIHYHGRPIKKIQTSWAGALKRAGITRRIRPYDLRHHFVTRALEAGADMKAVSEVVGTSPETLRRYYQHVTSKLHRRAVDLIPPLDID